MIKLTDILNEADQTYFDTFAGAADYAKTQAEKKGYEVDENDWFTQIGTGGKYTRSRPSIGKMNKFIVGLTKNGKPQRKALSISVYGMESGKFELTYYIN